MLAKSNGLEEECQNILEASGLTEDQISLPEIGQPLAPPKPVVPTYTANWPVKSSGTSVFEKALMGEELDADELAPATNGYGDEDLIETEDAARDGGFEDAEEDEDAAGWDMGGDDDIEVEDDFVNVESVEAGAGSSEADLWTRNSPIAADHVAGGSFESAMQLLNRQVGAVNFKPIEWRFQEIYQASRTFLPASVGLPPLVNYVRRTIDETDSRKVLPLIPRDLESITATEFAAGKNAMRTNKLEDGVVTWKKILHLMLLNAVTTQAEVAEAKRLIATAGQYTLAMSIELERRRLTNNSQDISALEEDTRKRAFELAAYFTIPELDPAHKALALFAAMNFSHKNRQHNSALSFANTLLDRGSTNAKFKESARKIKTVCERNPNDAVEIDFDTFADFEICAASYTPIYTGSPSVACQYCGVKYQAKFKGTVCKVCEVCQLGAPASGLRLCL